MQSISRTRFIVIVGAGLLFGGCADPATDPVGLSDSQALSAAVTQQDAMVNWHAQQAGLGRSGPVAGASASVVRTANGASFRLSTTGLMPGNAYTLWLVVVNNPDACNSSPCTAADLFVNPAVDAQVRFAAGHVAGGSGRGTFAGAVQEGPMPGWLADRSFDDSMEAEIHLVINDHGPMLPDHMPGMIRTYRGGCADSSPFPGVFPATALADGEPGPNTCRLYQVAILQAP
jgi:hypothetical protein